MGIGDRRISNSGDKVEVSRMKHTRQELKEWQALPLGVKILMTQERIRNWVREYGEEGCYVAFSGGIDSTVLLDIVRNKMGYKRIPAVFSDTGLEYPEIREFVKTFENVEWVKPKLTFKQVIEKYGYPVIGKEISNDVDYAKKYLEAIKNIDRQTGRQADRQIIGSPNIVDLMGVPRRGEAKESAEYEEIKKGVILNYKYGKPIRVLQLEGKMPHKKNGVLTGEYSKRYDQSKWAFLLEAPFPISARCCSVMKKGPMKSYSKRTGRYPMTGQMADESALRLSQWLRFGCNMYDAKIPTSNPLAFWTRQDVLHYIKENNLPICSVYGEIVADESDQLFGQMSLADYGLMDDERKLKTTGCQRTGCMFCGYGCHLEKPGEGRFEMMKKTHSKQYDYIMRSKEEGGLDYKNIIDWINEHGNLNIRY